MSIQGLTAVENDSLQYVKDFCSHNYPQSSPNYNLASLMSHSGIAAQISPYKAEISAAAGKGKPWIMGETNSGIYVSQQYYTLLLKWFTQRLKVAGV